MSAVERPCFEPVLTKKQALSPEESWGVKRRLMMMALSRSSDELIAGFSNLVEDNDETLSILIDQISDYSEHLKYGVELAEVAVARLLIVGKFIAEG